MLRRPVLEVWWWWHRSGAYEWGSCCEQPTRLLSPAILTLPTWIVKLPAHRAYSGDTRL